MDRAAAAQAARRGIRGAEPGRILDCRPGGHLERFSRRLTGTFPDPGIAVLASAVAGVRQKQRQPGCQRDKVGGKQWSDEPLSEKCEHERSDRRYRQ